MADRKDLENIEAFFIDYLDANAPKKYPCWRHHKVLPPILVTSTDDDEAGKKLGYGLFEIPLMANHQVANWFWDFEDMSPKQLAVYAKEEYGVDLDLEFGQERLFRAVLELGKAAPQNRNRLVLMAQSMKMNYEETLLTIRKMIAEPGGEVTEWTVEM